MNESFLAKLQSCTSKKVGNQKWCRFFDLLHSKLCLAPSGGQKRHLMQCTRGTSAYHDVRFLVHFCLTIWANFETGGLAYLKIFL